MGVGYVSRVRDGKQCVHIYNVPCTEARAFIFTNFTRFTGKAHGKKKVYILEAEVKANMGFLF